MITFTKAYVANGKTYASLGEAQVAEIEILLAGLQIPVGSARSAEHVAQVIVQNGPAIVNILTTTAKSRPRARKENGGRKQRKSQNAPNAQPALAV